MQYFDFCIVYVLLQQKLEVVLVDCWMEIEYMYVGYLVGVEYVVWQEGFDWEIDLEFVDKVKYVVKGDWIWLVLLICCSGYCLLYVGDVFELVGFLMVINVLEGFEGLFDEYFYCGKLGGWCYYGLFWQ